MLAYLRKGDSGIILEATHPFLPVGQARYQHYNQAGWLVDSKNPLWEKLQAPDATEAWFGQVQLSETGELSGRLTINVNGALAAEWRSALSHKSEQEVLKETFATTGRYDLQSHITVLQHSPEWCKMPTAWARSAPIMAENIGGIRFSPVD